MSPAEPLNTGRGLTVENVASHYRVSPDRVRAWIRRGELKAINTSDVKCARPRFVVLTEWLAEFEKARAVASPPKPAPRRRQGASQIDYYAD